MTIKLIIAGGRDYADLTQGYNEICAYANSICGEFDEIIVLSGSCSASKDATLTYIRGDGTKVYGADGVGERVAFWNGWKVEPYPADWHTHRKSAGPIRNKQMAKVATHCLVFWDGISRGTKDMIGAAENEGIAVKKIMYEPKITGTPARK